MKRRTTTIGKTYAQAEIVLVGPEPTSRKVLKETLCHGGYPSAQEVSDPRQVQPFLKGDADLLVFDLDLPQMDGFALLSEVTAGLSSDTFLPILALASPHQREASRRSIRAGAKDYLSKPVDPEEFLLHVHSLLDSRFAHLRVRETRDLLEDLVRRRTAELRQTQQETLDLLGRVAEVRDDATGEHTRRVGRLSGLIALEMGLPPNGVRLIAQAAPLHDLGKIAVTDQILLKEGSFESKDERVQMRAHAALGAELLKGAQSGLLKAARVIAASHHERWDGLGYPRGLKGEEIPLAGRIVAVADVFDALTHARPYKPAWTKDEAIAEIEHERGWQFDPKVVDALLRVLKREQTN